MNPLYLCLSNELFFDAKLPESVAYSLSLTNEKVSASVSNLGYFNYEKRAHVFTASDFAAFRLFFKFAMSSFFGYFSQPPTAAETGCKSLPPIVLMTEFPAFIRLSAF